MKKFLLSIRPEPVSVLCVFLSLFIILIFALSPVDFFFRTVDKYWILSLGEFILENKHVPHFNVLGASFSQLEQISWVTYQWLFALIVGGLNKYLGVKGLIWFILNLFIFTVASLGYGLYRRNYRGYPEIFIALAINIIFLGLFFDIRPFAATIFFCSLLGMLLSFKKNNYVRWICLPILFLLWANTHLGFVFGLAWLFVESIFFAKNERSFKPLLAWFTCFAVTNINPNGFSLFEYLFNLHNSPYMNSAILELKPLFFNADICTYCWIVLGFATFIFTLKSERIRPAERIIYIAALCLALMSIRHLCFLIIILPVFFAESIKLLDEKWSIFKNASLADIKATKAQLITGILVYIIVFTSIEFIFINNNKDSSLKTPQHISNEFIEYIDQNLPQSLILTNGEIGSELIYFTNARSYIDTRYDMYKDNYVKKYSGLHSLKDIKKLDTEGISYIAYPLQEGLFKENIKVLTEKNWQKLYEDEQIVLLKTPRL